MQVPSSPAHPAAIISARVRAAAAAGRRLRQCIALPILCQRCHNAAAMVVGDDGIIPQTLVHEVDVRRRGADGLTHRACFVLDDHREPQRGAVCVVGQNSRRMLHGLPEAAVLAGERGLASCG